MQEKLTILIERPKEIEQIVTHLLNEQREPSQNIIALWGPGGCGKTVLALLTCCCVSEIFQHFRGGIFWVDLGEEKSIVEGMKKLYRQLTHSDSPYQDVNDIATELLARWDRNPCLIVLDDVKTEEEFKKFYSSTSEHCTWLVTTRRIDVFDKLPIKIQINSFEFNEATELIYRELNKKGDIDFDKLKKLVSQLYEWPLLVDLVRKEITRKINVLNYTPNKALDIIIEDFKEEGWAIFKDKIHESLKISLETLKKEDQERFKELVIFPGSEPIPVSILAKLWGLGKKDVRELCEKLYCLSLLQSYDPKTICMNSILRQSLIQQQDIKEKRSVIHKKLLRSYGIENQPTLPENLFSTLSVEEKIYLKRFYQYHLKRSSCLNNPEIYPPS